jgi:hypothetical protein
MWGENVLALDLAGPTAALTRRRAAGDRLGSPDGDRDDR